MSAEDVAKAFVQHFYSTLNSNPAALAGLYQANSTLTFEAKTFVGPQQIIEKYQQISPVQHDFGKLTHDVQMSVNNSSMLIFVTGNMRISGGNPLLFSQVFQLVATGPNQYYVHNDIFRLIYA